MISAGRCPGAIDHPSRGLRIVRDLIAAHQAPIPVIYINRETGDVDGASWNEVEARLRESDLLLNVGGVCSLPEFVLCRRRAIIDMDPLFTQVERFGARTLADYHVHFSYGANIGRDGCTIPTRGIAWRPTVPPVVLDLWEWAQPSPDAPFTTVANWGSYGGVTYQGEYHGQKDQEFLRLIDLPQRACQPVSSSPSPGATNPGPGCGMQDGRSTTPGMISELIYRVILNIL